MTKKILLLLFPLLITIILILLFPLKPTKEQFEKELNDYLKSGDYEEVIFLYKRWLSFHKNDYIQYEKLAHLLFRLGKKEELDNLIKKLEKISLNDFKGYHSLGNIYNEIGEVEKAKNAFEISCNTSDKLFELCFPLYKLYKKNKLSEKADSLLTDLLKNSKEDWQINEIEKEIFSGNLEDQLKRFYTAFKKVVTSELKNKLTNKIITSFIKEKKFNKLKEVVEQNKDDPIYLNLLAVLYMREGKEEEAITILESALKISKEDKYLLKVYSDLTKKVGYLEKAIDSFEKLKKFDTTIYPFLNLAGIYGELGRPSLAMKELNEAINYVKTKHEKDTLFMDMILYSSLMRDIPKVISLYQQSMQAHNLNFKWREELTRKIINIWEQIGSLKILSDYFLNEKEIDSKEILFLKGEIFKKTGHLEEAKEVYKIIVENDKNDIYSKKTLGEIYKTLGKLEEAYLIFYELIKIKPNDTQSYINLIETLTLLNRNEEIHNLINQVEEDKIKLLCTSFLKSNKPQEAVFCYKTYITKNDKDLDGIFGLGLAYKGMKEYHLAVKEFKTILEDKRYLKGWKREDTLTQLIEIYKLNYNIKELDEYIFNLLLEDELSNYDFWFDVINSFKSLGEIDLTIEYIKRFLKFYKDCNMNLELGTLYMDKKEFFEAKEVFNKVIKECSFDLSFVVDAYNLIGRCLSLEGRYYEAIKTWQDVIKIYPNEEGVRYSQYLIAVMYDLTIKDKEMAKLNYHNFLEIEPDNMSLIISVQERLQSLNKMEEIYE